MPQIGSRSMAADAIDWRAGMARTSLDPSVSPALHNVRQLPCGPRQGERQSGSLPTYHPSAFQLGGGNLDRALWISWYDLPDAGRDAYLSWAHGTYMPAMVKRPGVLYAGALQVRGPARGAGRRTALPHERCHARHRQRLHHDRSAPRTRTPSRRPTPRKLHAELSKDDQKMLATAHRASASTS